MSADPNVSHPADSPPGRSATSAAASGGGLAVVGAIAGVVLFPLIWLGRMFIFRVSERQGNQVATFTNFSSMAYVWPIVLVGYVCAAVSNFGISPAVLGWTWVATVVFVLIVLGTDINRNLALVWGLIAALVFTGGALVHSKYSIPVLGWIYDWFAGLQVTFNPGIAVAVSTILLIILLVVLVHALFDGRHEISSREVMHRRLMRASESLPLTINRVRLDWPDMLEMITLFGSGHLVVTDGHGREVMRIANIPFLWFYRDEVKRILDIMATTEVAPHVLDANP
ncbi:MAG: hypothetical protein IPM64_15900 [Phycisphaerales bacterium]|nr:hypothetical protein [Phycisphaerales bacterium]